VPIEVTRADGLGHDRGTRQPSTPTSDGSCREPSEQLTLRFSPSVQVPIQPRPIQSQSMSDPGRRPGYSRPVLPQADRRARCVPAGTARDGAEGAAAETAGPLPRARAAGIGATCKLVSQAARPGAEPCPRRAPRGGFAGVVGGGRGHASAHTDARHAQPARFPKLTVRVRFPSPAPPQSIRSEPLSPRAAPFRFRCRARACPLRARWPRRQEAVQGRRDGHIALRGRV
jgi:hypothetical protein